MLKVQKENPVDSRSDHGAICGWDFVPGNRALLNEFWQNYRGVFSPITGASVTSTEFSAVFNIRFPRLLLGLGCGAALATSGVVFQGLFNNPLATPDTLEG